MLLTGGIGVVVCNQRLKFTINIPSFCYAHVYQPRGPSTRPRRGLRRIRAASRARGSLTVYHLAGGPWWSVTRHRVWRRLVHTPCATSLRLDQVIHMHVHISCAYLVAPGSYRLAIPNSTMHRIHFSYPRVRFEGTLVRPMPRVSVPTGQTLRPSRVRSVTAPACYTSTNKL